jgi:hypothetical protein
MLLALVCSQNKSYALSLNPILWRGENDPANAHQSHLGQTAFPNHFVGCIKETFGFCRIEIAAAPRLSCAAGRKMAAGGDANSKEKPRIH